MSSELIFGSGKGKGTRRVGKPRRNKGQRSEIEQRATMVCILRVGIIELNYSEDQRNLPHVFSPPFVSSSSNIMKIH